ncbi:hypothetical protein NM208_g6642 [Fusarium decemcellulare]|uniref:Uncharacterized protein n=1 Tax=Fusarium decemcellulare TaxID=57161 RepID=A0ACC1SCN0_9HYPO|nr:hypothetical protein NM208_g6642 [Fusarium decemcellulare]
MDRPSWWYLYATVLAYMMPTLAYYIAPTAEVEARRALAAADSNRLDMRLSIGLGPDPNHMWIACEVEGQTTGIAHTKCLQREEALDPNLCGDVCVSNTYNLLCTNDTAPYCRTYAFPQGVRDYRCAPTPATRVSSADFTYDGQKHPNTTVSTFGYPDGTTSVLDETESLSATGIESAPGASLEASAALALIVCIYWSRRRQSRKNPTSSTGGAVERERVHQKHHSDLHAVTITRVADSTPARASRPSSPDPVPRPRASDDQPEVVHELGNHDARRH